MSLLANYSDEHLATVARNRLKTIPRHDDGRPNRREIIDTIYAFSLVNALLMAWRRDPTSRPGLAKCGSLGQRSVHK